MMQNSTRRSRAEEIAEALRSDPDTAMRRLMRVPYVFAGVGVTVGLLVGCVAGVFIGLML